VVAAARMVVRAASDREVVSALLPCPMDRIAGSENSTMMTWRLPLARSIATHLGMLRKVTGRAPVLDRLLGSAEGATAGREH
jgi:hypothetical protein